MSRSCIPDNATLIPHRLGALMAQARVSANNRGGRQRELPML